MRVLIAGAKSWPEPERVGAALDECLANLKLDERLTIVHGWNRGADNEADKWAFIACSRGLPVDTPERHPARWGAPCREMCSPGHRGEDTRGWTICPRAGYYRNEEMAALGADLCLAFISPGAREAIQCEKVARRAGIATIVFRPLRWPPS